MGGTLAWSAAGGFAAGAVQTGTLRGATTGAITAMAFAGVAKAFPVKGMDITTSEGLAAYSKLALASGITGGVLAQVQGGRFGNGFVSAGASAFLSPIPELATSNAGGQMVIMAVIGGTMSEVAGGKFANGAITAAFAFAVGKGFKRIGSGTRDQSSSSEGWLDRQLRRVRLSGYPELQDPTIISEFKRAWNDSVPGDMHNRHEEGGYWGFEASGNYGVRRFSPGTRDSLGELPPLDADGTYQGLAVKGMFHTHPNPRPIDEFGVRRSSAPSFGDFGVIRNNNFQSRSYIIDNLTVVSQVRGMWDVVGEHDYILGR